MRPESIPAWAEIRVVWKDAHAPHSGWHEVDDYEPEDATATTIGRYWPNCKDGYITTAGTVFKYEDDSPKTVGDINHIPDSWILQIEVINGS